MRIYDELGNTLTANDIRHIDRVELIDSKGRQYVRYFPKPVDIELCVQDNNRTLKIFLNQ